MFDHCACSQHFHILFLTFDLRERMAAEYDSTGELLVDLGSDQTSCHNPFNGGYYPVQLSFEEANQVMTTDTVRFKNLVQERLDIWCILWCYMVGSINLGYVKFKEPL